MAGRQEALHAKKLESALRSQEKFPINLEWMVDVFKYLYKQQYVINIKQCVVLRKSALKYKHISSLTTHLKRHFKMNVHYKRFSQEQNKRVWTYFITVECFIGICEYVRHAARKKIANVWLRKVGVKGSNRRTPRDFDEEYAEISEDNNDEIEEDYEDDDEQEEEIEEEEYEEDNDDNEYIYYYDKANNNNNTTRKRRIEEEDDEEYQCEEEEDEDEAYFQEMEKEEASLEYDSEDSVYQSNTSSLSTPPSKIRRISSLSVNTHSYRALNLSDGSSSSATSSPCSSPPSSPSLSISSSISLSSSSSSCSLSSASSSPASSPSLSSCRLNTSNGVSSLSPLSLSSSGSITPPSPALSSSVNYVQVPVPATPQISEPLPAAMWKEQDWSYLHLRPNNPMQSEISNKIPSSSSLLFNNPQVYYYPQIVPYNYFFNPAAFYNCQPVFFSNVDSFGMKDSFLAEHSNVNLLGEERQFDTNMFLSIPEEHHLFTFQS